MVTAAGGSGPLRYIDSDGKPKNVGPDTPLPILVFELVNLLAELPDYLERIQQQLGRITGDNLQPGERFD